MKMENVEKDRQRLTSAGTNNNNNVRNEFHNSNLFVAYLKQTTMVSIKG